MTRDFSRVDPHDLDRYITGNWGEDSVSNEADPHYPEPDLRQALRELAEIVSELCAAAFQLAHVTNPNWLRETEEITAARALHERAVLLERRLT